MTGERFTLANDTKCMKTPNPGSICAALFVLFASIGACTESPQSEDGGAETGDTCSLGELGCGCNDGQCLANLECQADVCVDPNCVAGSEFCECAFGGFCFAGLECLGGVCQSGGTDGSSSDGSTEGCTPNAYTQCVGGDVYWFDSCGVMGDLQDACDQFQTCTESSGGAECQSDPVKCNDGTLDPGEDCDNNNFGGETCQSLGLGPGTLACSDTCKIDTSNCGGVCGDGVINQGEDCDGNALGRATCDSLGFTGGGNLSCSANCKFNTNQCLSCECLSGSCCDGCNLLGPQVECEQGADVEYGCPSGTDPGDDVSSRTRGRYCSGSSEACDGNYGQWSAWQVYDMCSTNEYCAPGDSSCNVCSYSYDVTQYKCSTFSAANGMGAGGGEIMRVCASTDPQGYMTVKAHKYDGSTFGSRPYQVRVSLNSDDPCGPATNYFLISNSNPSGIGTNELVFSFPSQWLAGQTEKAYCVTASTKPGDLGYDPNNAQQQSWWWSDKAVLVRQCN